MVIVCLNRPEYRNDVAEEIRLFLGLVEIVFVDAESEISRQQNVEGTLVLTLLRDRLQGTVEGSMGEERVKSSFTIPDEQPLTIKKHEKRNLKLTAFTLLKKNDPQVETPWGSLTGIRPTKLFRELSTESCEASAEWEFGETFSVTPDKIQLAKTICHVQKPYIESAQPKDLDIYIGIPFCRTRCLYCSFASEVLRAPELLVSYLSGLKKDILAGAEIVRDGGYHVRAMYIGGGTPTVLSTEQLRELLTFAFDAYGGYGNECTVEAGRPDTIDAEKLKLLKALGVDRISINPQTMNDETLRRIGRAHTVEETIAAYRLAREIGFSSINMDVIAGLPGETVEDMSHTYAQIGLLQPDNLTVHALAIKRSSLLKKQLESWPLPSAQEAEQMIADGRSLADALGMQPYYMYRQKYMSGNLENVGYAAPDKICMYNIDMMEETVSILSHGAGSMTKRVFAGQNRIERQPNPKDVPTYLEKLPLLMERKRRFFLD